MVAWLQFRNSENVECSESTYESKCCNRTSAAQGRFSNLVDKGAQIFHYFLVEFLGLTVALQMVGFHGEVLGSHLFQVKEVPEVLVKTHLNSNQQHLGHVFALFMAGGQVFGVD